MGDDYKLVYSIDGDGKHQSLKKNKGKKSFENVIPSEHTLLLQLEKKHRGGKIVTVVKNIPLNPPYMQKICKELKKSCGGGGSLKQDQLEIQGDHKEKVAQFLKDKGFIVKGV